MPKSVKPSNNTYWDSTGIVHNRKSLNEILNGLPNVDLVVNAGESCIVSCENSTRGCCLVAVNSVNASANKGLYILFACTSNDMMVVPIKDGGNIVVTPISNTSVRIQVTNYSHIGLIPVSDDWILENE